MVKAFGPSIPKVFHELLAKLNRLVHINNIICYFVCHNVDECAIWMASWYKWVFTHCKLLSYFDSINLICLDSRSAFFFMLCHVFGLYMRVWQSLYILFQLWKYKKPKSPTSQGSRLQCDSNDTALAFTISHILRLYEEIWRNPVPNPWTVTHHVVALHEVFFQMGHFEGEKCILAGMFIHKVCSTSQYLQNES